jgi:hypothetical protein
MKNCAEETDGASKKREEEMSRYRRFADPGEIERRMDEALLQCGGLRARQWRAVGKRTRQCPSLKASWLA